MKEHIERNRTEDLANSFFYLSHKEKARFFAQIGKAPKFTGEMYWTWHEADQKGQKAMSEVGQYAQRENYVATELKRSLEQIIDIATLCENGADLKGGLKDIKTIALSAIKRK